MASVYIKYRCIGWLLCCVIFFFLFSSLNTCQLIKSYSTTRDRTLPPPVRRLGFQSHRRSPAPAEFLDSSFCHKLQVFNCTLSTVQLYIVDTFCDLSQTAKLLRSLKQSRAPSPPQQISPPSPPFPPLLPAVLTPF